MAVFAVFHEGGRPDGALDELSAEFGRDDVRELSDDLIVVRTSNPDPEFLKEKARIGSERQPGIVFKLNASHSGYYRVEFWDWLKQSRGEA